MREMAVSNALCAALLAYQETTREDKMKILQPLIKDLAEHLKEITRDIPRKSLLSETP